MQTKGLFLSLKALNKLTSTVRVKASTPWAVLVSSSKNFFLIFVLNKASPVGVCKWQMWQEWRGTEETLKKISAWLNAAHSCQCLPIKSTRWSNTVSVMPQAIQNKRCVCVPLSVCVRFSVLDQSPLGFQKKGKEKKRFFFVCLEMQH